MHAKIATTIEVGPPAEAPDDPLEIARRIMHAFAAAGATLDDEEAENQALPALPAPPPTPQYVERERKTPDPRFAPDAPIAEAAPAESPPTPEPGPADPVVDPKTGRTMAYAVLQMRNRKPKPPPVLSLAEAIASVQLASRPTIGEWRKDQRPSSRYPLVISGRSRRWR